MAEDTFDWSPLGPDRWQEIARELGATDRQLKFAAARFRGCSATEAARQAGVTANSPVALRGAAHSMSRTNIVMKLLLLAGGEADGDVGNVNRHEARQILSRLARGSDPTVRIRALETLAKLDEADRVSQAAPEMTLAHAVRELLSTSPDYGPIVLAEAFFKESGTVFGMPYLKELAPILKRNFPPAWERYRMAIKHEQHRAEFDALGDGPYYLNTADFLGPAEESAPKAEKA